MTRKVRVYDDLRVTKVDRVRAGANSGAHIVLWKSADAPDPSLTPPNPVNKNDNPQENDMADTPTVDDLQAQIDELTKQLEEKDQAIEKAEAERDEAQAAIEKAGDADPTPDPDPLAKADLPEEVRKQIAADREALAKARDDIAKMQRDARVAKAQAEAKADFAHVGKAEDVAEMLLAAEDALSDEQVQSLRQTLKAANARIAESDLYSEFGGSGKDVDAEQVIKHARDENVKQGLNAEEALAKALEDHPTEAKSVFGR